MGFLDVFNPVLAGVGAATDIFAGIGNYNNQKKQLEYQKQVQQTTWDREDNAVQRKASDLEAAGMSKTLAAGGSAQTSAPINVTAPQANFNASTKADNLISSMKQSAEIHRTKAENKLIDQNVRNAQLQNEILTHDFKKMKDLGLSTKSSGMTRQLAEGGNMLGTLLYNATEGSGVQNSALAQEIDAILRKATPANETEKFQKFLKDNDIMKKGGYAFNASTGKQELGNLLKMLSGTGGYSAWKNSMAYSKK